MASPAVSVVCVGMAGKAVELPLKLVLGENPID